MRNKVYLVGAGPGNPNLITLRGLEVLKQADVVIYDYLVDKRILEFAKFGAELICADSLGKTRFPDGFLRSQKAINNLVVKKAKSSKRVIRLKNGDPFIFGRSAEEIETLLRNNIEFEVIPGVTAASAAACFSGIPLTSREFSSSVSFVTGHEALYKKGSSIDWGFPGKSGTIVLYMAIGNLSAITKKLIAGGVDKKTPVAVIKDASLITQKILKGDISNIAGKLKLQKITPPAIVIIGNVVTFEKRFNWLKNTKRTLFTGISTERFFGKGFIYHLPVIKIVPLKNYNKFDKALKSITYFDWIIFSSRYGVKYFFERLFKIGFDARALNNTKIAVIGGSTKRHLVQYGILADLVPKIESATGLIEAFRRINLKDKSVFFPRSSLADKGLSEGFKKLGAKVTSKFAYNSILPGGLPELDLNYFDEIMFTSPSGVRNFLKRYGCPPKKVSIRCIGEVTLKEARKNGLKASV